MRFDFQETLNAITAAFIRLPLAQRILLPLAFAVSVIGIVFLSRWATRPDYAVLFSNMEVADAGTIVERLKDMKIAYQVKDDGRTVAIAPGEMVPELRLQLASMGLPKGGSVGFELLSESKFGETSFKEWANYLRMMQGELERSIQSIEAVKAARVHITNPRKSLFVSRDTPPTASVVLLLKPGSQLTPVQIKGITRLVAGSVERLAPENVAIVDQQGSLLNEPTESSEMASGELKRLDYQRSIEAAYGKRVESMLSEVLGSGRAVARVMAEVDFSHFEKEEESYDPAGVVTRSERAVSESANAPVEGGVSGVISNLSNEPGILSPPDSGKNGNLKKESVKNYEISRAVSKTVAAPGQIRRLSVAVLVDGQYSDVASGQRAKDGTAVTAKQYRPLAPELLRKIENLVKQAVGFDATRGDTVSVENIQFATADAPLADALENVERTELIRALLPYTVPALVTLAGLFFAIWLTRKLLSSRGKADAALERLLPGGLAELEAELAQNRSSQGALSSGRMSVDITELEQVLSENVRLVKENPQQAALLIRHWLSEGRTSGRGAGKAQDYSR